MIGAQSPRTAAARGLDGRKTWPFQRAPPLPVEACRMRRLQSGKGGREAGMTLRLVW